MIVGTAGHIDHGKTALVRALTGVDTDRLKEEKARGISIDLGFAYLPPPTARALGFVDVPGHERFVRNMLGRRDRHRFVLLVVAADDGVMPQTREHVDIARAARRAPGRDRRHQDRPRRRSAARAKCATRSNCCAHGTRLEGAPIVAVSSMTAPGTATDLRAEIARQLRAVSKPRRSTGCSACRSIARS